MEAWHDMGGHLLHDSYLGVVMINKYYVFHVLTTDFTDYTDSFGNRGIWQLKLQIITDGVKVGESFEIETFLSKIE